MFTWTIQLITAIQSFIIIIGSIVILQKVLKYNSLKLRLAFITLPIASSMQILDLWHSNNITISYLLIDFSIIMILYWMWCQKDMIFEVESVISTETEYVHTLTFEEEVVAIVSCFAIWVLKRLNTNIELRCAVCDKILHEE